MYSNRLLRSAPHEHEAVLYDFLARHYESEVAQKRTTGSFPAAAVQAPVALGG